MPPVYVHHLFWHAPLAFCAFHTYGRKNNDDTDDSVYTGIEYNNKNHDAEHKIVLWGRQIKRKRKIEKTMRLS